MTKRKGENRTFLFKTEQNLIFTSKRCFFHIHALTFATLKLERLIDFVIVILFSNLLLACERVYIKIPQNFTSILSSYISLACSVFIAKLIWVPIKRMIYSTLARGFSSVLNFGLLYI